MKRRNVATCIKLRKSQTDAEKKLWLILRNRQICGFKFRRQFGVGKYILDFYCADNKLAIEADGGQHFEDDAIKHDKTREEELKKLGIKVLRFNNNDILNNIEGVYNILEDEALTPHPGLLPKG